MRSVRINNGEPIVVRYLGFLIVTLGLSQAAVAQAEPSLSLAISQHQFVPATLAVPAGVRVKLSVVNKDALPAEFESYDLSREIVVPGHAQVTLYVGPLQPGRYRFFNDFDHAAQGFLVAGGAAAAPVQ